MEFNFNMLNHTLLGQMTLKDVIGIIGHQLRELGHKAVWYESNTALYTRNRGYNIVVEGFTGPIVQMLAEAHAAGARFICLATEEPTEKGFNHGRDREMVQRQHMFPFAAQYFDAIIHTVPGKHVTDWYSQFCPSAYVELGHAKSLVRITSQIPNYDFGFFGSLSNRRVAILKRLNRRTGCSIKITADFPDQLERDAAVRDAKVVLQIRKQDEMGLVSSSRCNTSLCCGRPIFAEPHLLSKPWDQVVHFSKAEATEDRFFFEALVLRATWQASHRSQLERFKELFPPETSIGEPLFKLGILPTPGRIGPVVVGDGVEAAA